jgi:hypothetical protein
MQCEFVYMSFERHEYKAVPCAVIIYVLFVSFIHAHSVIDPWAVELACK